MKSKRTLVLLGLTLVFACLFLYFAARFASELIDRRQAAIGGTELSSKDTTRSWGSTVEYEGKTYHLKDKISTVLFLGTDYGQKKDLPGNMGTGPRADTIILFILNDADKTIQALSISRDTITEVDLYKENGDYAFSGDMQINMQYAFGDSPSRSCYITKKTVSELLYEKRIDYCLSLSVEGIGQIVDAMGGLTLTMAEDYTYIDPRYTEGATVTMNGEEAEHFLRMRDTEEFGSNNVRMQRTFEIIAELFEQLREKGGYSYLEDVLSAAEDYVVSDLDAETMKKFASYTFVKESLTLPGENVEGVHDEFYVDDAALEKLLLSLFYEEK